MKARLLGSKKWTVFPKEYTQQIQDVFNQEFSARLGNARLVVEGRIYPEEILLRVGFVEKGQLRQNNFEVSLAYTKNEKEIFERISNCIDAAASMMNEYLDNDGEVDFPRTWKEYNFSGTKVYLQYSTTNTDLEAQADALLGRATKELVRDSEESSEDALGHIAAKLEEETDDEELSDDDLDDSDYHNDDGDDEDASDEPRAKKSSEQPASGKSGAKPTIFTKTKKKRKEDLH